MLLWAEASKDNEPHKGARPVCAHLSSAAWLLVDLAEQLSEQHDSAEVEEHDELPDQAEGAVIAVPFFCPSRPSGRL